MTKCGYTVRFTNDEVLVCTLPDDHPGDEHLQRNSEFGMDGTAFRKIDEGQFEVAEITYEWVIEEVTLDRSGRK